MCDGLTLVYDDESGTWGEAPETYGSIAFETQEALEKAVNILNNYKWTSVDEALPEIDKPVLVYYQYYWGKGDIAKECGISKYYNHGKWGKWSTLHIPIDSEVLYWQPLPEPPVND